MTEAEGPSPLVAEAIGKIEAFITRTTGEAPTPEELSYALTRYFVLKEIMDFITMSRAENKTT